jgi:hypothetical protein
LDVPPSAFDRKGDGIMRRLRLALPCVLALCAATAPAIAGTITLTGAVGPRAGSVTLTDSGPDLIIRLSNVGQDVLQPDQVMTGYFFSLAGNPVLTPVSATLAPGSTVLFGGSDPGGVVGGEWVYQEGIVAPLGANRGIASAGYGLFGSAGLFPGSNLAGPIAPNGLQYGLVSAVDNPATGNAPVTGGTPLIRSAVTFVLTGLPSGFDISVPGAISNGSFQYGTSLTEPNVPDPPPVGVPEPASILLLAAGLMAAWLGSRNRPA